MINHVYIQQKLTKGFYINIVTGQKEQKNI